MDAVECPLRGLHALEDRFSRRRGRSAVGGVTADRLLARRIDERADSPRFPHGPNASARRLVSRRDGVVGSFRSDLQRRGNPGSQHSIHTVHGPALRIVGSAVPDGGGDRHRDRHPGQRTRRSDPRQSRRHVRRDRGSSDTSGSGRNFPRSARDDPQRRPLGICPRRHSLRASGGGARPASFVGAPPPLPGSTRHRRYSDSIRAASRP
ncbi:hypothetical protein BKP42_20630 [Rhodococcus erythropolis]|nr:hypothetical protein BKP42_20630 [Rhodococcus erythropolis]